MEMNFPSLFHWKVRHAIFFSESKGIFSHFGKVPPCLNTFFMTSLVFRYGIQARFSVGSTITSPDAPSSESVAYGKGIMDNSLFVRSYIIYSSVE
jgi:hypothetical protein